jgi:hypothetical protein
MKHPLNHRTKLKPIKPFFQPAATPQVCRKDSRLNFKNTKKYASMIHHGNLTLVLAASPSYENLIPQPIHSSQTEPEYKFNRPERQGKAETTTFKRKTRQT